MNESTQIEILAGSTPQGEPILEKLPVESEGAETYQLTQSPAFVKGVARGDQVKLNPQTGQYEILCRSGNLCLRVYSRGDTQSLAEKITPALEKLGGQLDIQTPRMLVYSIHVSCGFTAIENIFNDAMDDQSQWLYGNVYDPNDGVTPLNWWLELLKPQ